MKRIRWAILTASLVACGTATSNREPARTSNAIQNTILSAGDVFEVRVFGEKELSGTYRIAADGSISFPLLGRVVVSEKTPPEVGDLLSVLLKRYIREPNVSIFVQTYNSKKIFVFGHVQKPGTFVYEDMMTIVQAITLAGGFDALANQDDVVVTRVIEGQEQRINLDVKAMGEGRVSNFRLEPGDIVFVRESLF